MISFMPNALFQLSKPKGRKANTAPVPVSVEISTEAPLKNSVEIGLYRPDIDVVLVSEKVP